jgi:hypothetical protein
MNVSAISGAPAARARARDLPAVFWILTSIIEKGIAPFDSPTKEPTNLGI